MNSDKLECFGTSGQKDPDDYSDGNVARFWKSYIGDRQRRTKLYKEELLRILNEHNCRKALDVACGDGIDSIMLLEEGFDVTSVDGSKHMLLQCMKIKEERGHESHFQNWTIKHGNWLTIQNADLDPNDSFDAVLCIGNSFPNLPDSDGKQTDHLTALRNFRDLLKPGGILIIDHRNFDEILSERRGSLPSMYYQIDMKYEMSFTVKERNGAPWLVYDFTVYPENKEEGPSHFSLSSYPHRLECFSDLLRRVFGCDAAHTVLPDFHPHAGVETPGYYVHVIRKAT